MPVTITKSFEFDAAHRLPDHPGKCRTLHGHRYRVEVRLAGDQLDQQGMLVDFGKVKALIGGWIDQHLDHTVIYSKHDRLAGRLQDVFRSEDGICRPWYGMDTAPTAEAMAREIFEQVRRLLKEAGMPCWVTRVRLYETPTSWAEWT